MNSKSIEAKKVEQMSDSSQVEEYREGWRWDELQSTGFV